jgi:hypothetical protein
MRVAGLLEPTEFASLFDYTASQRDPVDGDRERRNARKRAGILGLLVALPDMERNEPQGT